jgi:hypothetical protein
MLSPMECNWNEKKLQFINFYESQINQNIISQYLNLITTNILNL